MTPLSEAFLNRRRIVFAALPSAGRSAAANPPQADHGRHD
jgi:hypothetical protein